VAHRITVDGWPTQLWVTHSIAFCAIVWVAMPPAITPAASRQFAADLQPRIQSRLTGLNEQRPAQAELERATRHMNS